jgi:3-hydroxyacyl-[acyl-carrier-protein] dehydratase
VANVCTACWQVAVFVLYKPESDGSALEGWTRQKVGRGTGLLIPWEPMYTPWPGTPFDTAVLGLVVFGNPRTGSRGGFDAPSQTDMQFILIDRILELDPGRRIVAVKNLTLAEEYLAEHFPGFPVMPGVLMLEAVSQASAWLIRTTEDYAHSVIVLKSAKAVRYGNFVTPGSQLSIEARIIRVCGGETELQARGTVDGVSAVSGRVIMEAYNLRDHNPTLHTLDSEIVAALRRRFMVLARDWLRIAGETTVNETSSGAVVSV